MVTATVKQLKEELQDLSSEELIQLCLRLSRFKKENKELLTYLLFESGNEEAFIGGIKNEITELFEGINRDSFFYIKKSVRKILRMIKKYCRYSLKKETEVELLLHFCKELGQFEPSIKHNSALTNIYNRQISQIQKIIPNLHEDLQHDYSLELKALEN